MLEYNNKDIQNFSEEFLAAAIKAGPQVQAEFTKKPTINLGILSGRTSPNKSDFKLSVMEEDGFK